MATKKYLSLDRLIEYDALIKAEINSAVSDKADTAHNHDSAYDTKGAAESALADAKTYADDAAAAVKNDLLNGAGEAYDTLKELGDLIDDNQDAIDALEIVAAGKADAEHIHAISDVTNLQTQLDAKAESDHIHDNATTSAAGFMSASDKVKIDAFNGASQTATTPATTGWYRIATSAVGISVCSGIFQIRATEAGRHTSAIITANTVHGLPNSTGINVLACSNWNVAALTQARIVYHPSSSGNYAYLEVYLNVAATVKITVNMISGLGWTLIAPNTVGEIPSGYQSKTVSLLDNVATPTSKGLMSSADKLKLDGITVSATEINYLDGVTSSIQDQLDDKATSDALAGKVDKVSGKGLSTNDYTNEDKTKLDAVPETISDGELIAFVEYTEDDIQALWDSVVV